MNLEFLKSLQSKDCAICDNFITSDDVQKILADFDSLNNEGAFHKAGTGKQKSFKVNDDIRNDLVFWLEPERQNLLWNKLELLKNYINQHLMLGLWEFEGHYSLYQAGSFYKKHLDSFKDDDARVLSFILYLNQEWTAEDGGQLQLFLQDQTFEVQPLGGRLICFLSHKIEHEVLVTNKPRKSFTGWFKRRVPLKL